MTQSPDAGAPATASVGDLLGDITRDISTLLRQEVELAKAEARDSVRQATKGGSMFAGAAVSGLLVLVFASIALWWALGDAMGRSWAALVVTAIWLVIGAVLFAVGRRAARNVDGLPQTADSVKKIPHALQGHEEKNA